MRKKDIAVKLGVCLSTVYREVHRGEYRHKCKYRNDYGEDVVRYETRYSPNLAQDKYRINMTSKGIPLKIGNDYEFVDYVEKRVIYDKISPCAVLGEIKRKKMFRTDISKTTLYRYIELGIFANISMQDLPIGQRKKHYRKAIAKRPPRGTSIEKRPASIAERNTFGHFEMDCVVGKQQTKNVLLVLTERLTRYEMIFRMPNKKTESVVRCLDLLERRYGKTKFNKIFKSITVDNGTEFSDHIGMEKSVFGGKRTDVYYCHPYTSCERGSNERINRDIRRWFPKGTDFSQHANKKIRCVENWVNNYPRAIFGYATPAEMFAEQLAAL
nr:IS30 family transposase [Pumilibacter muris]